MVHYARKADLVSNRLFIWFKADRVMRPLSTTAAKRPQVYPIMENIVCIGCIRDEC